VMSSTTSATPRNAMRRSDAGSRGVTGEEDISAVSDQLSAFSLAIAEG